MIHVLYSSTTSARNEQSFKERYFSCNSLLREIENGRVWHLEREVDNDSDGKGMTGVKTVPEVFLTRLSATKIPLQKFVDDLFNVIFTPNEGITALPPCVKYLMDFLDAEAARLQINDPEVCLSGVHIKCYITVEF